MILRIRTQLGTWRIQDIKPEDKIGFICSRIENEHQTTLLSSLSADILGTQQYDTNLTIQQVGLKHGDMLYASVDEAKTGVHENAQASVKRVTKTGDVVLQSYENISNNSGFRPGMLSLRSMKKHWTLNEFIRLDEQFCFKLKAADKAPCTLASTDKSIMSEFVGYMQSCNFQRIRIGYLYGSIDEKTRSVRADFLYEPPQQTTDVIFELLDDPMEERVTQLTQLLGVQKVGWVFSHPPRETNFHFTTAEIMCAAEQQLLAAGGIEESLFVTVKVTLDDECKPLIDAWQVTKQCMEMVAEGALQAGPHPGMCLVNPTFTAIVEGKPTPEVDNNFFLSRVPIGSHESIFIATFPRVNRVENSQSAGDIKRQLTKLGKEGWTMKNLLADFQLLLFLCNFMDMNQDLPRICQAVTDLDIPLDEGYELLIRSIADI